MNFVKHITEKAKSNIKTIVLPESTDIRILHATEKIGKEDIANIILIGDEGEINKIAMENNLNISKAKIVNHLTSNKFEEYASAFYELRKNKGMTIEEARETLKNPVYFGTMMLKLGECDGLVSGAVHSTSDTLRPALQIIKAAQGVKLVSSFFTAVVPNCEFGEDGFLILADCGLNENPNAEELAEIAIETSKTFRQLTDKEAKIAMLSYSTYGSAKSESIDKVVQATKIAKERVPELLIDGELQVDAAIVPAVAEKKAPGSNVAGIANTLIFPDLNAGNIGYKLIERFGRAELFGPICQGLAKPVNDLSRGCKADDIVGAVAITAVQANKTNNE